MLHATPHRAFAAFAFILLLPVPFCVGQQPPASQPPAGQPAPAAPTKALLKGATQPGDQWQVVMSMLLEGQIAYRVGDKTTTVNLKAKAEHKIDERVLKAAEGQPTLLARFYNSAQADVEHHNTKMQRTVRPDRRLMAAQQSGDGTVVWSPAGSLTREELDLCGGHVDILAMHFLLPGKEVGVGTEWDVPMIAAQALAGVDGVTENKLKAKLEKIENDIAFIGVAGSLDGIQQGGESKMEFRALIEWSVADKRFLKADWRTRVRKMPGPIYPERAVGLETATSIAWLHAGPSKELTDAVAAQIAPDPTPAQLALLHRDAKGRLTFTYDRGWHIASVTDDQLVMRFLERGELLGQMNLRSWKAAAPGGHMSPDELKPIATQSPGFAFEKVAEEGQVPAAPGCWVYRITAVGKAGETPLQQSAVAVASPRGDQCLLIFSCELALAPKFAGKDLAIAKAIEFPAVVQTGGR